MLILSHRGQGSGYGLVRTKGKKGGGAKWVDTVCNGRVHIMNKKPLSHELGSE